MGFVRARLVLSGTLKGVRRKQCAVYVEEQDFFIVHMVSFKMGISSSVLLLSMSVISLTGSGSADVSSTEFSVLTRMPLSSISLSIGDHKAFSAIDDAGFYQFCPVRRYVDHHVRGFDLEFPGVGDVGCYQS